MTLQAKEMGEAATHQLKAELKHGKKEAKVLLGEAQWEYDSQSSHHLYTYYTSILQNFVYMSNFSIPIRYLSSPYFRPCTWGNTS